MIMHQTDKPMTGFRPFFNPATGEWIEQTTIPDDTGGEFVRFNWRSVTGRLQRGLPATAQPRPGADQVVALVLPRT